MDLIQIAVHEVRARAIVDDFGRAAHARFSAASAELAQLLVPETDTGKAAAILASGLRAALVDVEQLLREALGRLTTPEH